MGMSVPSTINQPFTPGRTRVCLDPFLSFFNFGVGWPLHDYTAETFITASAHDTVGTVSDSSIPNTSPQCYLQCAESHFRSGQNSKEL